LGSWNFIGELELYWGVGDLSFVQELIP